MWKQSRTLNTRIDLAIKSSITQIKLIILLSKNKVTLVSRVGRIIKKFHFYTFPLISQLARALPPTVGLAGSRTNLQRALN